MICNCRPEWRMCNMCQLRLISEGKPLTFDAWVKTGIRYTINLIKPSPIRPAYKEVDAPLDGRKDPHLKPRSRRRRRRSLDRELEVARGPIPPSVCRAGYFGYFNYGKEFCNRPHLAGRFYCNEHQRLRGIAISKNWNKRSAFIFLEIKNEWRPDLSGLCRKAQEGETGPIGAMSFVHSITPGIRARHPGAWEKNFQCEQGSL